LPAHMVDNPNTALVVRNTEILASLRMTLDFIMPGLVMEFEIERLGSPSNLVIDIFHDPLQRGGNRLSFLGGAFEALDSLLNLADFGCHCR
jgi:hypothetical protein